MDEIELELIKYLNKHPEIIKKSLDDSYLYYDTIKVNKVEIEDGGIFLIHCQTLKKSRCDSISTLPIPKKFLRKIKLNQIKILSLQKGKINYEKKKRYESIDSERSYQERETQDPDNPAMIEEFNMGTALHAMGVNETS